MVFLFAPFRVICCCFPNIRLSLYLSAVEWTINGTNHGTEIKAHRPKSFSCRYLKIESLIMRRKCGVLVWMWMSCEMGHKWFVKHFTGVWRFSARIIDPKQANQSIGTQFSCLFSAFRNRWNINVADNFFFSSEVWLFQAPTFCTGKILRHIFKFKSCKNTESVTQWNLLISLSETIFRGIGSNQRTKLDWLGKLFLDLIKMCQVWNRDSTNSFIICYFYRSLEKQMNL